MKSYKIFLGFGLLAILIGFILTPSLSQLWEGFLRIQTHHLRLDTDMFSVAGNFGAPFMNASLVMLASLLIMFMTRTEIRGLEIGTLMLMFSFAFYSKSFFNLWPLVIGVFIEAKQARRIFSNIVFVALMASALGPFVSSVAFDIAFLGPGSPIAIGLAYLLGIVMGFVLAKVNAYFWTLHQGRILFNVGFTAGIIGVFTYNLFKVLNIEFISGPNTEYLLGINSK